MEKIGRRERERRVREESMVEAAEALFAQHGFENVSMDAIAKEAEFTKRTLYQYFSSKEDLYFAVILKGFKQLALYCETAAEQGKTGFEKLRAICLAYYRFYQDFPETFRLMNAIGRVKTATPSTPKREEFMQFDNALFEGFARIIESGQADGSIRPDIEPMQGACAMAFMLTGFFAMLSETGQTFIEHFALDQQAFSRFALDLLSDALRTTDSGRNDHPRE